MIASLFRALAAAAVVGLAACGGGGGGGSAPAAPSGTPEGLWLGTSTAQGVSRNVMLVVLGDGSYYGLYGNSTSTLGMFQGAVQSDNSALLSTNGRDFMFGNGQPMPFTLTGEYSAKKTMQGVAAYPSPVNVNALVSLTYEPSYETPVSLSTVAGTYSGSFGTLAGVDTGSMQILSNGVVTATTSSGCHLSGNIAPRGSTSVLSMTLTFDLATCGRNQTASGVAGMTGSSGKQLTFGLVLPDRSDAALGVMSKP